jgi:serine-type D-Ala-D-Ala carboxypeptidase (penicillin-binding protein 5/6)
LISPIVSASGSIGIDLQTGAILFEKNPHERLPIASITKLMTVLITLEENDLEETITVSGNASAVGGSTMYLRTGEEISVKAVLLGALINSANDAAISLAEHNAGSVDAFVEKMNKKALSLGLINTHFANPMGLDNSGNYSSAYDIAKLSKYIYQKEFVRNVAVLEEAEVQSVSGNYTHKLKSTNTLLGNKYYKVKGLKTGSTDSAGLCLVSVAENDTGNEIITVVLRSPARFRETKILIDWIFRAYKW